MRSYRTYEEWKLDAESKFWHEHIESSYRTYEEWKRGIDEPEKIKSAGSYRTYEEWKLLLQRKG